jgi:mono/diheme cytochrome c family protein
MKAKFLIPVLALFAFPLTQLKADDGGDMFKQNCGACHTVGKGKLVGPDLKGVETRHSEAWILKWVKGSQAMVQAGDKEAVKLFTDNSSIPMPDQALNDDQIKTILGFIKNGGEQTVTASASPVNGTDNVAAATQKAAAAEENSGSLLTSFSFTEYMLMFLMGIMLIIIYVMGISIKSLAEKANHQEVQQ